MVTIGLEVNGERAEVAFAPHKTLLEVLREDLNLTGTKHGCELRECGTCTVLLDGTPVLSCLVLGLACAGRRVKTVEGMAERGMLHPLQEAFAELGAAQCGYCTPAFLLAAEALLATSPSPTRDDIKQALSGNLCRCTGYIKIYEAVELAAARLRGEAAKPAPETLYGIRQEKGGQPDGRTAGRKGHGATVRPSDRPTVRPPRGGKSPPQGGRHAEGQRGDQVRGRPLPPADALRQAA